MQKINLKPKNNIQMPKKWNIMNPNYEQKFTPHKIQTPNEWNGLYCSCILKLSCFHFPLKDPKKIWTSFYKCFEGCLNAT